MQIIIMNDSKMRPIATDEVFFWYNVKFHDSVLVQSERLLNFINKRITGFKKVSIGGFSVSSAIIIKNAHFSDTLYSDSFFQYWKIRNVYYKDTLGDIEKLFGGLFIEKYASER